MEKLMNIEYSSSLLDIVEANPSFDVGKLRIAYTGKNRNNSFISKETFEKAVPTMYGCPIVARYDVDADEIGSHDSEIVRNDAGDLVYVTRTEPIGFVPPGASWFWEVVEEKNTIHQYLTTEVVLWRRQAAYQKVKDNGITGQSMEITVEDGEMCDDYYNILAFYFTAFCLLGTAEPCFESAALFTFESKEEMQKQLSEMVEDFKLSFSDDSRFKVKEGDVTEMDKLNELLEKYNLTEEDLDFETDGLSDEELEAKFAEAFKADQNGGDEPDEPGEPGEPEGDPQPEDKFALSSAVREALRDIVCGKEQVETEYGSYCRYYLVDYDAEAKEVYFEDSTDWKLYGTTYEFDGDDIKIDFDGMKRKKVSFVDFVEGAEETAVFNCAEHFGLIINAIDQKHSEEYTSLSEKYNDLIASQNKEAVKALFEQFEEKLGGTPEFEAMRKSADVNADELEEKLYSLLGRKQFSLNEEKSFTRSPKAPIVMKSIDSDAEGKPYGDYFNY